jgi:phosphoglycerate dehydrogenase-like enzyme
MPKILITSTLACPLPELPFEVVRFAAKGPLVEEGLDAEVLVVWMSPRPLVQEMLARMPNLRWIQTLSNGVDQVLGANPAPHITITNGKGLHDAPTAELAVTLLLNAVRQMPHYHRMQQQAAWDKGAYDNQLKMVERLGTLEGAFVVVVGMGGVGLEIAQRLKPFGATVEGVATRVGVREGFVTHALEDLPKLAERADALIACLPETEKTIRLISADILGRMQGHAWFVNVGRGSAVDEAALLSVLEKKKIAGAALDVFAQEPLPDNAPWWTMENVIITPHIAGGGPRFFKKACALLARNCAHYGKGEPLENLINRDKGY